MDNTSNNSEMAIACAMNDKEKTSLLYLLGALQFAPEHKHRLIKICEHPEYSEAYRLALDELRASKDVAADALAIRKRLL